MSPSDYRQEYAYRISERLGFICGTAEPTEAQLAQAKREVAEDMDRLEAQEKTDA